MSPDSDSGTRRVRPKRAQAVTAAALIAAASGWLMYAAAQVATQPTKVVAGGLAAFRVVGDGIPDPLAGARGDAKRGRALILAREAANCLLCHALRDPDVRFAGNVGPPLDGVAQKLSTAQLRLRMVDNFRLDPAAMMPSYYRVDGFDRVASAYRGKPILAAGQIEDIVAYLATLK